MQMVKTLHGEDRYILNNLADNPDYKYASHDKTSLRSYIEIEDGLYVESNTSTQYKISILRKLFENYQRDPSDLIFYLDN